MANLYTSVLGTAGHAPDQFGAEILMDLPNNSQMANLVAAYVIPPGEDLVAPVFTPPSLRTYTRGSGETAALTFDTISDTSKSFTKRARYVGAEVGWGTLNDMPADRLSNLIGDWKAGASMRCGNDIDDATLGLWSSAAYSVGGVGVDFSSGLLAEAVKRLKVANAPEPYYAVLPGSQWDAIATDPDMKDFDKRGQSPLPTGVGFNYYGMQVFTNNNCPTASGIAHGLVFSARGIRLVIRDRATITEGSEMRNGVGYQVVAFLDYAYLNSFTDWIVDFQTTDQ